MALKLSERLFGGCSVLLELLDQGVGVGELLNVAQPRNEGDFEDGAIQFGIALSKQVCFYCRRGL